MSFAPLATNYYWILYFENICRLSSIRENLNRSLIDFSLFIGLVNFLNDNFKMNQRINKKTYRTNLNLIEMINDVINIYYKIYYMETDLFIGINFQEIDRFYKITYHRSH